MISSFSNKKVKELSAFIKKSALRRKSGLYVVEGVRMAEEIPPEDRVETYVSESFWNREERGGCRELLKGCQVLSDPVFSQVSGTETPQGILVLVRQKNYTLEEILQKEGPNRLLILENLRDPGNMGTLFRSAEAAGATGMILGTGCVEVYNPKVVRSTMGALLRLPFVYCEDLEQVLALLCQAGIASYAACLEGEIEYDQADLSGDMALIIGNEAAGISPSLQRLAKARLNIPMEGGGESLNASVAGSVLLFEAARQRRIRRLG